MGDQVRVYAPADEYDSDDEDDFGYKEAGHYEEFEERLKNMREDERKKRENSEEYQLKMRLQNLFADISNERNQDVIEELNKGIDIDIDLHFGWTPLLLACSVGNAEIVGELLKRFANVNKSKDGMTPLMAACSSDPLKKNPLPVVELLIEAKADIKAVDSKRKTALMLAAYNGHLEVVKKLLPLSDKFAEDNQKWTALTWAVSGDAIDVVKLLLEEDYDLDKVDVRGHTILHIAEQSGTQELLDIIPQEKTIEQTFFSYLNSSIIEFEDNFKDLSPGQKPLFLNDVYKILYGTRSEVLSPLVTEKQLSLFELLSTTPTDLQNMGVAMPYQRNRIVAGLYKFHKHPYHPKSTPVVPKNDIFSNIDVAATIQNNLKQLICMEASLSFMIKNLKERLNAKDSKEEVRAIEKIRKQLDDLKRVTKLLAIKCERWDSTLKPADLIKKQLRKIPWISILLTIFGTSLIYIKFRC